MTLEEIKQYDNQIINIETYTNIVTSKYFKSMKVKIADFGDSAMEYLVILADDMIIRIYVKYN